MKILLFFVPSLLGSACGSLNAGDHQRGGSSEVSSGSRLVGATSSRNVRDRQMSHWGSRSHPKFDEEDQDGAGQISYPSLLEEPSPLRFSTRFARPVRLTRRNWKMTKDNVGNDGPHRSEQNCVIDVFPSRSDVSMLMFSGQRRKLSVASDPTPAIKNFILRCPRAASQDQRIQEPVFVEEPGWILIEMKRDDVQGDYYKEDPFYVARGKKSMANDHGRREERAVERSMGILSAVDGHERSRRTKHDAFVEGLREYLIESERSSLVSSRLTNQNDEDAPVLPRNKHSDLLDILNEPFFISRGKKGFSGGSARFRRSTNGYSRARVDFETTERDPDTPTSQGTNTSCNSTDTANCSRLFKTRRTAAKKIIASKDE